MRRLFILLSLLISSFSLAEEKTIILAADPWCPWNCSDSSGIALDIAREVYEPLGYKVEYSSLSWSRAIAEAVAGRVTGLVGADRGIVEIKDFIFPKVAISHFDDVYVVRDDSKFVYKGIGSLKDQAIGIIDNYHFGDEIGQYIEDNYNNSKIIHKVTGTDGAYQSLEKLVTGHIDMYLDDRIVILYTAQKHGLADKIKIGGHLKEDLSHYIVFSPAFPDAQKLADLYDAGVIKLKADGRYKKIFAKYGLEPTN